jgi:excinuclease UvrABC nuclease subunit
MTEPLSWIPLGLLTEVSTDFSTYSKDIGIYRAILNDEVVYIGKATELENGGFRKRLRDYTRSSTSARNYPAGELMHSNRHNLHIEIVLFERTLESVPKIESLETQLIREMKPIWNLYAKGK